MIPANVRKNAAEHYLSLHRQMDGIEKEIKNLGELKQAVLSEIGQYNEFFRSNGITPEEIKKYDTAAGTSQFDGLKSPQSYSSKNSENHIHYFVNDKCACGEVDD